MSYLLDTDVCASIIRDIRAANLRFAQHTAVSRISVVSITELEMWLLNPRTPLRYRTKFFNLAQNVPLLPVTEPIAHRAAMIHHGLRSLGQRIHLGDALIAATALEQGLTLITRPTPPFTRIPGLTVIDWSIP
jgi:predicted nucleic acid-binding protein